MISTIFYNKNHLDHLKDLNPEEGFDAEFLQNMSNIENTPETPAFTITYNAQPIGIIGGYFEYPSVMKVYALLTKKIKFCPKAFHREVLRIIGNYFDRVELKRMQMDVRADFPEAHRWAEGLGFHKESVKKNYGFDCTDYYVYARLSK